MDLVSGILIQLRICSIMEVVEIIKFSKTAKRVKNIEAARKSKKKKIDEIRDESFKLKKLWYSLITKQGLINEIP